MIIDSILVFLAFWWIGFLVTLSKRGVQDDILSAESRTKATFALFLLWPLVNIGAS